MNRPFYPIGTEGRISNALARACKTSHRAHYLGHNTTDGADVYQVHSNHHKTVWYFVRSYPTSEHGGYVYTRTGSARWLTCSCESYTEHTQPCAHAGRVALRLEREAHKQHAERLTELVASSTMPTLAELYR